MSLPQLWMYHRFVTTFRLASFQYVAIACSSADLSYVEDMGCNSDFMNIVHGIWIGS